MTVVDVLSHRRVYGWYLNYLAVASIFIDREHIWKKYYIFMTCFSLFASAVLLYSMVVFIHDIDSLAVIMHHSTILIDLFMGIQVFYFKRKTVRELIKGGPVNNIRGSQLPFSGFCLPMVNRLNSVISAIDRFDICSAKSFDYESPLMSKFLDDLQDKREKIMEKVFKYIMFTGVFMQINVIIFAIVEKYLKNLDFFILFPCWFPFDLSYLPYRILAILWQHLLLESLGLIICATMAITYIVNSHLTSQIVLLKFAIKNLKPRVYEVAHSITKENSKETFKERLRKCYIKETVQCVKHYSMIIDYYTKSQNIFEIVYLMVFLTGLILLTSTGFALISENTSLKIKFIGVNIVQMVYLYIFCWLAENISELGESIRLSIYGTEWYEMPKECQSSLKLMIERTLKPLEFYTLTGQKVDLENYMAMVKASYSYFNMMLATQQK